MKYFFSPNEADRPPLWTLQTCPEPFSGEQVAYLKAAVCFLTRICAWPRINPGGRLEKESSLGFWCFSKLLLYHPFQGYVCINKEFKKLYLASPGPALLLVSSEGWCWKQSHQSWFCSEIVTQVLLCWDYNADHSHCEWWMYCRWSLTGIGKKRQSLFQ